MMMIPRRVVIFIALAALTVSQAAAEPRGYYRWPTISGDRVVFTAEGDLWEAPVAGGVARRLTTAPGEEMFALFSPDGKWIAFSGNYDGNLDVNVMPSGGGEPRRLTFHPYPDFVAAWTPDGKIVFRSRMESRGRPFRCYTISPEGGFPEPVPVDQAAHITYEPDGDRIAYTRFSLGFHTWKRYQGGWAERIWVGNTRSHDYRPVTTWPGNNSIPMWYKGRIYYLRDNDARMNVHSMKPDGSDVRQHTFHADWDARWPTVNDGRIVYGLGADIWVYDIARNETRKIEITLPSDLRLARDRFVSPEEYTNDFALSPDGKRLLIGARGEIFTAPTERRGVIRQVTRTAAAREKMAAYLPKGDSILAWSDLAGEEALYLFPAKGIGEPRKIADGSGGWHFDPAVSPDGKFAVYGDNSRRLQLVDLSSGETSLVDTSAWEMRDYAWSPDSRYLAYTVSLFTLFANDYSVVRVYDVKEKMAHTVTDEEWSSFSPTWDPEGKWLYFLSARFMNPHPSFQDWSFIVEDPVRVYAVALDTATVDPFAIVADGVLETKDEKDDQEDDDKKKDDEQKETKVDVKIVWPGLPDRMIELPIAPGNYYGLLAMKGKLYYASVPSTGWLRDEDDEEAPETSLHLYDIEKRKDSEVVSGVRDYTLSADLKKIAIRKKDGFIVMDAGATEVPKEDEDDKDAGLHLDDWTCDVEPRQEWRQIFNEAWRLQRDFFYDPNMHGVDWKAQREHYASLLDRIATRDELNDLIAQMISELNAGHAYVGGGDVSPSKSVGVGLLGIDVTRTRDGFYRIERILTGDRWDKDVASPLAGVGIGVKVGDYIVAIDGIPTSTVTNYFELLANKAGRVVSISVNHRPSVSGAREIVVKTLRSEGALRYRDWVRSRQDYVRNKSGGRLGYLHLPDMGGAGLREWMRQYYPQSQKEGLIIDVRENRGGNIAEWILTQLDRRTWSWNQARNGQRYHKPTSAFQGHLAALCDEETSSDGETFAEGFKQLKLGPLIGKRTWGGWLWIRGDKPFVDRGFFTQPEFAGWDKQSRWLIEGPGVSPDVEVENHPAQVMQGVDEQLDDAITRLLDKLQKEPVVEPTIPPFPNKASAGMKK